MENGKLFRTTLRLLQFGQLRVDVLSIEQAFTLMVLNWSQNTVKTRIKEHVFWGLKLILFLYIGCFLQNQPESVLKAFLKNFL